uniref:Secreted protein n=1 Tax=Opuntia streptacantha TaxID=393608 RepID=A0A7C8YYQ0_OPUST
MRWWWGWHSILLMHGESSSHLLRRRWWPPNWRTSHSHRWWRRPCKTLTPLRRWRHHIWGYWSELRGQWWWGSLRLMWLTRPSRCRAHLHWWRESPNLRRWWWTEWRHWARWSSTIC